ncbi:MAG TPA: TerC family protein [Phycisphaerales bacterium]|nr:TerC family protein [Phycisphaerales bacterium]
MEWLTNPEIWIALITLTVLEIVLGIDNIIFISIVAGKLPKEQQPKARRLGLLLAMFTRILLLLTLSWLVHLTKPFFTIPYWNHPVSGRDIILFTGGLFLIYKSTHEIHEKMEGDPEEELMNTTSADSFGKVLVSIAILDIVFSIDSVITAVGMVEQVPVMVAAIVIAVGAMVLAADSISEFVDEHPTVKMLALSFLLLIGLSLVGEGLGHHIPKPYIYFSMGFSAFVEFLNLRSKKKGGPKQLASIPLDSETGEADKIEV